MDAREKAIREEIRLAGNLEMQSMIDNGSVWLLEGSMGRLAMSMLESGECILPLIDHRDYYGNIIPSRNRLVDGTKGTLGRAERFYNLMFE